MASFVIIGSLLVLSLLVTSYPAAAGKTVTIVSFPDCDKLSPETCQIMTYDEKGQPRTKEKVPNIDSRGLVAEDVGNGLLRLSERNIYIRRYDVQLKMSNTPVFPIPSSACTGQGGSRQGDCK